MSDTVRRIHTQLDRLVRRERGLLSGQAFFGGLAAGTVAWAAVAGAFNLGWARPDAGWIWVGTIALAGVATAAWPLREWMDARDRRRQAVRVEAAHPVLRGELLTVLDRTARPLGPSTLVDRLATRVDAEVRGVPPPVVLPATPVRRSAAAWLLALAILALCGALLPAGPIEAVARLVTPAIQAPGAAAAVPDGPRALVGDITLRYLYPTYTGLDPLDVPNASGDVHAPPGTRVEVHARTAVVYPSAELEVYDLPPEAVPIAGGRDLATAFTVAGPGVWRFRFGTLPSPDYHIVPDPDLAPDVSIQVHARSIARAVDQPINFQWAAKDDYGLTRIMVEVKGRGPAREVELRAPPDVPRLLGETASLTPRDLGLSAGDKVTLRVKAWDNDAVSGAKAGVSAGIELEVLGPTGAQSRMATARRELRDAFVRVLAGYLVEPRPAVADRAHAAAWTSEANARYEDADTIIASSFAGGEGSSADRVALAEVKRSREALLSFVHGFATGSGELAARDLDAEASLQADHVEALEGAILLLDSILRSAVQAELARMTDDVAAEAGELKEDLSSLTRDEALARLDQLDRLLQQLLQKAAQLGEGELKEFLNQRGQEMDALVDEIRKALAEGRTEDAKAMMERLANQLQELADGMRDQQQREGERSDKLAKAMETLQKELQSLQEDQAALRKQTEEAREKYGSDMDQAVSAWAEVEKLAGEVAEEMRSMQGGAGASDLPSALRLDLLDRVADAEGLYDSARARDLETAADRALRLQDGLLTLDYGLTVALRRAQDPATRNLAVLVQRQTAAQRERVTRIRALLDKMKDKQERTSPALQQELERLASQQQQVQERAEQAADHASKLAPSLPMKAPGLERGAKQGAEQAGRAAEAMKDGDPLAAEGGQRSAEDGFREAQDALDAARENMQAMQQAAQGSQGEGEKKDGGTQDGPDQPEVALPAPEEFQTPEAYREALLEGMSGAVPDEYKALNRRYYEELVRQ